MKQHALFLAFSCLTIVSFLNSCRKEEARTLEYNSIISELPAHCFNGLMDEDETGFDCGGSCNACDVIHAPCTTTSNHGVANSTNLNFITLICDTDGNDDAYIRGNADGGYLIIKIPESTFTSRTWQLNYGGPSFDAAGFNYYHNFYSHWASSGEIYVNANGSNVSVEFCDVSTSGIEGFVNQTYILSGNLTCH